jgi:hypothetical protein
LRQLRVGDFTGETQDWDLHLKSELNLLAPLQKLNGLGFGGTSATYLGGRCCMDSNHFDELGDCVDGVQRAWNISPAAESRRVSE